MNHSPLFKSVIAAMFVLAFTAVQVLAVPDTMNRDEIPDQYKWDLSHIYADWDAWEAGMVETQALIDKYPSYAGRLAEGPAVLLEVLKLDDEIGKLSYLVYRYPALMSSADTRDNDVQAKFQRVQIMFARLNQETSWFEPELLMIPRETMEQWINETPELVEYRFTLMEYYRTAEHTLSADKEKLLSYFGPATGGGAAYRALSTTDVEFPEVVLSDGNTMIATGGNMSSVSNTSTNQADREAMFKAHLSVYNKFENTHASILNSTLQSNWAYAQARGYSEAAEMSLDANNIPVAVLENLINTAKNGSAPLQKYMNLRRQVLGAEHYRYHDIYCPIFEVDLTMPYDEVRPKIVASLAPFGEDYQKTVDRAFDERWFDVYQNTGKSPGAFSAGVYGVHPYMLLNYTDALEDAFTLAHEVGHTMHSVLSFETQPFATADYTLFVAEVASTVNEMFFLDYLLEQEKDPMVRLALLQRAIRGIQQTFYLQAMFADFELKAHRAVRDGQPITAESLQQLYLETFNDFWGDSIDDHDWYRNYWARISHFQRPFYVYQYATCLAGGSMVYEKMTQGKKKDRKAAVENYLNLLKSGGSNHPMELLKEAGIDWSTPAPAEAMVARMQSLVDQFEVELKKAGLL